ncbi:ornithine cyclodeaminase family protein [Thermosediminibacter litoriperuensis]|uniref:Delta(1)-pyrroline-2-carboxylate reductase n=1 Tax=Thermosediminibacter litoriperuensis TaxID=291989 RepID=A0A5S5AQ67_9FIRM|nr:ornithine cyclodeaminase family protein [Thermosediminibacter litoriperuensis]TYP53783.1 ornithine cyclodeaminase [Thermosediminibacter litoriperuensis]
MLILKKSDVEKALSMEEAINAMEEAFAAYSAGRAKVPLRTAIHVDGAEGDALFMPGYVEGIGVAVKLVSVFPGNARFGKPTISSVVVLEDRETGEPVALMDGAYLTALRTGAASGAASKHLARKDSKVAAVIGAGVQGTTQLWAVSCVRSIEETRIYDRDPKRVGDYIAEMKARLPGVRFVECGSADEAVREADIIITATTSQTPVFSAASVKKGAHINAIGAYTPKMQEIPPELLKKASKIVVDSREAVLSEAGDFIIPINSGDFSPEGIYGELGEITSGRLRGRESDDEITLFKTVGIAVQDVACAARIYEKALEMGLGIEVDLLH